MRLPRSRTSSGSTATTEPGHPMPSRAAGNGSLFSSVYRLLRTSLSIPGAVFHFHKHDLVLYTCDQINLPAPAAEISFQNHITFFFQIFGCQLLISGAGSPSAFHDFVSFLPDKMSDKTTAMDRSRPVLLQRFNMLP